MFNRSDIGSLNNYKSFFGRSSDDFEYACKYLMDESGEFGSVAVTHKGPKGGDGGIDLVMRDSRKKIVAYGQCKLFRKPGQQLIKIIRELSGCMRLMNIERGFLFVTSSANTYEKEQADLHNIEIIDSRTLDSMINAHKRVHLQMKAAPAVIRPAAVVDVGVGFGRFIVDAFKVTVTLFLFGLILIGIWPLLPLIVLLVILWSAIDLVKKRNHRYLRKYY